MTTLLPETNQNGQKKHYLRFLPRCKRCREQAPGVISGGRYLMYFPGSLHNLHSLCFHDVSYLVIILFTISSSDVPPFKKIFKYAKFYHSGITRVLSEFFLRLPSWNRLLRRFLFLPAISDHPKRLITDLLTCSVALQPRLGFSRLYDMSLWF